MLAQAEGLSKDHISASAAAEAEMWPAQHKSTMPAALSSSRRLLLQLAWLIGIAPAAAAASAAASAAAQAAQAAAAAASASAEADASRMRDA